MFSKHCANLLLFDKKSFFKLLRRLGFDITFAECDEIVCKLEKACLEGNCRTSGDDFEVWVATQVKELLHN